MGDRETRRLKEMERSTCADCRQPIVMVNGFWDHVGDHKPRHVAVTEGFVKELKKLPDLVNSFLKVPHKRIIINNQKGEPYLERMILDSYPEGGSKTYLHIIYKSDDDRDMHDHPWHFQSRIVYGRYINHMATGSVTYGTGQVNVMRAEDAHRLEILEGPVVTIVSKGPKIRDWGFHTMDGWVHHRDYLDKKFGVGNWTKGDNDE